MKKIANKKQLSWMVARKLEHQIHNVDVSNVISLFVDEFVQELTDKKEIDITHLALFKIEKSKPRKYHDLTKGRFAISQGKYLLKIKLDDKLRKQIIKQLDLIKTFI